MLRRVASAQLNKKHNKEIAGFRHLNTVYGQFSDLHGHSGATWCILRLHLGVARVKRGLVHELVVKLKGLQDFHVQL